MIGRLFGRLTPLAKVSITGRGKWLCRCSCGNEKILMGYRIRKGITKSCGCLHRERTSKLARSTHGLRHLPEYGIWLCMKHRCHAPSYEGYKDYGGRGIKVCDRWQNSFELFLKDMGRRPSRTHSIERENNNENYCPENCVWAIPLEQANNRRTNFIIQYDGKYMSASDAIRSSGISIKCGTFIGRIKLGWPVEKALRTPIRFKRQNHAT